MKTCRTFFPGFSLFNFLCPCLFLFLFVHISNLREGTFIDDLFRELSRDTKMSTGNGLKVACSDIPIFLPKRSCKV